MLKKEARELYKQKRSLLSPQQRMKLDDLLLIQFQKLHLPFFSVMLSFHPSEELGETETFHISRYLQFQNPGLQLAFPKTDFFNNTMQAIICGEDDSFEKNRYGISEPVATVSIDPLAIDMVLLPLLAFDEQGYRVGYGKGFYDRFLKQCRQDCLKIGLSYFEPIASIEDANDYDVPLNLCITPQKVYVF